MTAPTPPDEQLLGTWHLLRADPSLDFAPGVSMEFQRGGRLRYAFDVGTQRQTLQLVYRVEGNVLHTEYPGMAHDAVAAFTFGPGDVLIFDFGGARAWFLRKLPHDSSRRHQRG
ncbi:MAG: hypothetical protein IT361_09790 [Gemmatimonadaceae bacterium]|nr:hypothetical protein [Gemmatimonadaceae bacterium]